MFELEALAVVLICRNAFVIVCPSLASLRKRDNIDGWIQSETATSLIATPGNGLSLTAVTLNSSLSLLLAPE